MVHEDGLHVLSADVEYERYLRVDVTGGEIVGDGLYDALVEGVGRPYQVFAVSGRTASPDAERCALFGTCGGESFESLADRADGVAAVRGV